MTKRDMIVEALGLTNKRNSRWRSIWRHAGKEARARYGAIFVRELNKVFKQHYGTRIEQLIGEGRSPLLRGIPFQRAVGAW